MTRRRRPFARRLEVVAGLEEAAVRRAPARLALKVVFAPARELAVAEPVPGPCKRLAELHHQCDVIFRRTARMRFQRGERVQRVPGEIVA